MNKKRILMYSSLLGVILLIGLVIAAGAAGLTDNEQLGKAIFFDE